MHTLFHRLHNSFVDRLQALNPQLDVPSLFEHARRLVRAVVQAITYEEFLVVILGDQIHNFFQLGADQGTYDPRLSGTLANGYGAFAFRLGHTYVANDLPFTRNDLTQKVLVPLRDVS